MATLIKSWQVWGERWQGAHVRETLQGRDCHNQTEVIFGVIFKTFPGIIVRTLKSFTASVCRACDGSVVRGDVRASLLKHNMGCLQLWESKRQRDRAPGEGNQRFMPHDRRNPRIHTPAVSTFLALLFLCKKKKEMNSPICVSGCDMRVVTHWADKTVT